MTAVELGDNHVPPLVEFELLPEIRDVSRGIRNLRPINPDRFGVANVDCEVQRLVGGLIHRIH